MNGTDEGNGRTPRDVRADEAVAHLQQATLEFIAAARAVLDVAEEAVREPSGVMGVIAETVGGLAAVVGDLGPTLAERGRAAAARAARAAGDNSSRAEAGRPPRVEHIRIS